FGGGSLPLAWIGRGDIGHEAVSEMVQARFSANRHDFVSIRASDGIASGDSPRNSVRDLLKPSCFSFRGRHMGSMSLMHWLVVLAIVLVLFGAGKLPRVMGDFAKGIKAFKSGMKEEDEAATTTPPAQVTPPAGAAASAASVGAGDRQRD